MNPMRQRNHDIKIEVRLRTNNIRCIMIVQLLRLRIILRRHAASVDNICFSCSLIAESGLGRIGFSWVKCATHFVFWLNVYCEAVVPMVASGMLLGRRSLCLVVLLLWCIVLAQFGSGGPHFIAPQQPVRTNVVCEKPVWDFGKSKGSSAEVLKHSFWLKNTSQKQIKINRIVASCSCAVADDYGRSIPPGSAVEVPVSVSVFGPPGPFDKTFEVFLEEVSSPPVLLRAIGVIESTSEIYVTPEVVDFGELSSDPIERMVVLSRYDGTPLRCREILPGNPAISSVGVIDEDLAKGTATLRLSLDPSTLPSGRFMSDVVIMADHQASPSVRFGVKATIRDDGDFLVKSIVIPRLTQDRPVKVRLLASQISPTHLVSAVEYKGDDSVVVEAVVSNGAIDAISVSLSTGSMQHPLLAKGTVSVSVAGFNQTFEIPIRVLLPRHALAGIVPDNASSVFESDKGRKTQ